MKVHELMEESYLNMSSDNYDMAKSFYLKALDIYHTLPIEEKREVYADMYDLFRQLKEL